jgi:hypothetical protein
MNPDRRPRYDSNDVFHAIFPIVLGILKVIGVLVAAALAIYVAFAIVTFGFLCLFGPMCAQTASRCHDKTMPAALAPLIPPLPDPHEALQQALQSLLLERERLNKSIDLLTGLVAPPTPFL